MRQQLWPGIAPDTPIAECPVCGQQFYEGDDALYWPQEHKYFCDALCLASYIEHEGIAEWVTVEPKIPDDDDYGGGKHGRN